MLKATTNKTAYTNRSNGFTIVEMLITIVLFAILVPSIARFLIFLTNINDMARDLTLVTTIAQNKVEKLRANGYETIGAGTTYFTNKLPDSLAKPRSAKYVVSKLSPSLKQVDIVITYSNLGSSETYTYRTYIGELGVGQY